ncbi:uncharacterized protein LOC111100247 [Crassostrea virginica]
MEFCNHIQGCQPRGCPSGYFGDFCQESCPFPKYGPACQKVCLCSKQRCNVSTGCINRETPQPTTKIPTNNKSLKTNLVQTKPITFNVNRNMTESPEPDLVPSSIFYINVMELTTKQPNDDLRRFSTGEDSIEQSSKSRAWIKFIIILLSMVACVLLAIHIALLTTQRK